MVEATRRVSVPPRPATRSASPRCASAYAQGASDGRDTTARVARRQGEVGRHGDRRGQPTLLIDKLGERLAFEHAGARLYEALISKHQAYGTFPGGPVGRGADAHPATRNTSTQTSSRRRSPTLGGDPTALTPSANLAANISAGLPQVLSDPRTNLLQSLEAIVVAELADNECWAALETLARQAGHDELADDCQEAIEHERDHLRNVRTWIAAGQGRPVAPTLAPSRRRAGRRIHLLGRQSRRRGRVRRQRGRRRCAEPAESG